MNNDNFNELMSRIVEEELGDKTNLYEFVFMDHVDTDSLFLLLCLDGDDGYRYSIDSCNVWSRVKIIEEDTVPTLSNLKDMEDSYQLVECEPPFDVKLLLNIVERFNEQSEIIKVAIDYNNIDPWEVE